MCHSRPFGIFQPTEWLQSIPTRHMKPRCSSLTPCISQPNRRDALSFRRYLDEQDLDTPTAAGAAGESDAAGAAGTATAAELQPVEELPAERLAFSLGDGTGRIGVLAVKGRKVHGILHCPTPWHLRWVTAPVS